MRIALPLIKSVTAPLAVLALMTAGCGDGGGSNSAGSNDTGDNSRQTNEPAAETTLPEGDTPLGSGSYPIGELTISWGSPLDEEQTYTISCLGDTATLSGDWDQSTDTIGDIAADKMCIQLAQDEVQNRLVNGAPADQVCTQVFGSDHSATVTGTIDGDQIATSFHRTDGCGIDDWDVLMKNVLPEVS